MYGRQGIGAQSRILIDRTSFVCFIFIVHVRISINEYLTKMKTYVFVTISCFKGQGYGREGLGAQSGILIDSLLPSLQCDNRSRMCTMVEEQAWFEIKLILLHHKILSMAIFT